MPIRLGRFEMPKSLVKDEKTATDTYAKFIAEPFEAGYGHTIGNSLRRTLLSSLEGAAIKEKWAGAELNKLKGQVKEAHSRANSVIKQAKKDKLKRIAKSKIDRKENRV